MGAPSERSSWGRRSYFWWDCDAGFGVISIGLSRLSSTRQEHRFSSIRQVVISAFPRRLSIDFVFHSNKLAKYTLPLCRRKFQVEAERTGLQGPAAVRRACIHGTDQTVTTAPARLLGKKTHGRCEWLFSVSIQMIR